MSLEGAEQKELGGPWEKVRAGWYRAPTKDRGLWLHVIRRHPGWWNLNVSYDRYETARLDRHVGIVNMTCCKEIAVHEYGSFVRG